MCSGELQASSCLREHFSQRAQSPCPLYSRWQVVFEGSLSIGDDDSCPLSWADKMVCSNHSDWSQPEPDDWKPPPTLDLRVQEFLIGEGTPLAGNRCEEDSNQSKTPEPSLEDSNKWILWHACQVETPSWWPELQEAPNQMDIPQFARRMWALFQMSKVRCHASNTENDYLALPTPHCIERDVFLPFNNMQFGGKDYYMKQSQKTLAYAKVLHHWAEKA